MTVEEIAKTIGKWWEPVERKDKAYVTPLRKCQLMDENGKLHEYIPGSRHDPNGEEIIYEIWIGDCLVDLITVNDGRN